MTPEQVAQALDLIERAGDYASNRRNQDLESYFDASDRQVFQLAQLKSLNMTEQTTELLATLVAGGIENGDPLS